MGSASAKEMYSIAKPLHFLKCVFELCVDAIHRLISQRADVIVFEMLTGKIVVIIAEWSVDLEDSLNPLRSTLRPERYLGYAGLGATTISRTVPVGTFHFSELPLHGRSAYKTITHSSSKLKSRMICLQILEPFTMTKTTIKAEQFPGTMRKAWEREHHRVA